MGGSRIFRVGAGGGSDNFQAINVFHNRTNRTHKGNGPVGPNRFSRGPCQYFEGNLKPLVIFQGVQTPCPPPPLDSPIDSPIAYAQWKETEAVLPKFKTISPQGMKMSSAKSNAV